ncbi:MAG: hypothetical protein NTY33_00700 [Candidatus Moranbacteria bacterium]|nr:hypothetical protein [Candidatus Moranbacteria bacterium]
MSKKEARFRAKINHKKEETESMKKSIFTLAVVVLLVMAMTSAVFAQYEDIKIVPLTSDNYAYGTIGIKLYLNSKNVWEKQINPYNGTLVPDFDNPCWAVAEAMTQSNTTLGSDGKTRYPSPWIYPADVTVQPPVTYYVFGDAAVLAAVKDALLVTELNVYYAETGSQIAQTVTGTFNTAVVYSATSGMIIYVPVKNQSNQLILNTSRLKAVIAADSSKF